VIRPEPKGIGNMSIGLPIGHSGRETSWIRFSLEFECVDRRGGKAFAWSQDGAGETWLVD
jgi:hypothetical protein